MPIIEMHVAGMTCNHCVQSVTKAIQARDAHARVVVNLAEGLVSTETMLERASAIQAIEASGFKVLPCNRT